MKTNVTGILGTARTWHQTVRAVATANSAASGLLTIDGVTLVANDRVLLTAQTSGVDNGAYVAAAGAWTRAVDMLPGSTVEPTAHVPVSEGTSNEDSTYQLTTDGDIIVGTTSMIFAKIAGGGGGGIAAVVDDPSPELGGDLDCAGNDVVDVGYLSVGVAGGTRVVDILDIAAPQLRLTQTVGSTYAEFRQEIGGLDGLLMYTTGQLSSLTSGGARCDLTLQNSSTAPTTPDANDGLRISQSGNTATFTNHGASNSGGDMIFSIAGTAAMTLSKVGTSRNMLTTGSVTMGDNAMDNHAANGSLTLNKTGAQVLTGVLFTPTAAGSNLSGAGSVPATQFLTEVAVGDRLQVNAEWVTVTEVTSDSSLEVTPNFVSGTVDTSVDRDPVQFISRNLTLPSLWSESLVVAPTGNVGLNTLTPDRKLEIVDDTNPQLRLTETEDTDYVDIRAQTSGSCAITMSSLPGAFCWLRGAPTGTSTYLQIQQGASTADDASVGMTVGMSGTSAIIMNCTFNDLKLGTGGTSGTALTIDSNKDVTIDDGVSNSLNTRFPVLVTTGAMTLLASECNRIIHINNTTSLPITIDLPAIAGCPVGSWFEFKDGGGNAGTYPITIDGDGAETIDGDATQPLNQPYAAFRIYSDSVAWFISP